MFMQLLMVNFLGLDRPWDEHTPMYMYQLNVPLCQLQKYIKGKVTFVLISCFRLTSIEGLIHASQTMH